MQELIRLLPDLNPIEHHVSKHIPIQKVLVDRLVPLSCRDDLNIDVSSGRINECSFHLRDVGDIRLDDFNALFSVSDRAEQTVRNLDMMGRLLADQLDLVPSQLMFILSLILLINLLKVPLNSLHIHILVVLLIVPKLTQKEVLDLVLGLCVPGHHTQIPERSVPVLPRRVPIRDVHRAAVHSVIHDHDLLVISIPNLSEVECKEIHIELLEGIVRDDCASRVTQFEHLLFVHVVVQVFEHNVDFDASASGLAQLVHSDV